MTTRAKIGAQLWSRAVQAVLFGWILLTLWIVWHQFGVHRPWLHHAYFGRWILCGILNDTPLLNYLAPKIAIPVNGSWYALPSLTAWLDGPQVYGHSFYSCFWYVATGLDGNHGIGTDILPIAAALLLVARPRRRERDGSTHIRGLRLVTARELNRELHGRLIARAVTRLR
jgi:hypothetical protein